MNGQDSCLECVFDIMPHCYPVRLLYLELGTDAGWLLLLVQVQQRLGGAIVQRQTHNELQRPRIQQTLHSSK